MSNKHKKSDWALIDLVIPLAAFGLAAYYLYTLRDLPALAKYYGGAIAILIFLCSAAVVYIFFKEKLYLQLGEWKAFFRKETFRGSGGTVIALELLGMTIVYVGAIKLLGFTAATVLYLCAVMLFLGRRGVWRIILPAVGITIVGYVLFIIILNLNINLDPLSKSLKYWIRGWVFK